MESNPTERHASNLRNVPVQPARPELSSAQNSSPHPQLLPRTTSSPEASTNNFRSRAQSGLTLEAGASLTLLSPTLLLLPGAYLRADFPLVKSVHLGFGSIYGHRTSHSRLGRSTLDLWLLESSVVYRPVPDDLLRLALVAQWGQAWADGKSDLGLDEKTQAAMLAILRFRLSLRVPISKHWSVHAVADAGPVLRGAVFNAGGESVFRLQSFAAETSFGLGFSP